MKKTWGVLRIKSVFVLVLAAYMALGSSVFILNPTKVSAAADTCTWTGGGSDDNFSTAANWTGCDNGTVPENGDTLEFDMTVPTTFEEVVVNDMTSLSIAGIHLTGAGSSNKSFQITNNPLIITGDMTGDQASGTVTLYVDVTLGADSTYSVPSAALRLGNTSDPGGTTFDLQTHQLAVTATGTTECQRLLIPSTLAGSGNITLGSGSTGASLRAATSTYTGSIVNNGAIIAVASGALSSASTVTVNANGRLLMTGTGTHAYNVVMNSSANPSIQTYNSAGAGCSGGSAVTPVTVPLSGSLTLQANTVYSGEHNLNVSGTYTPGSNTLSVKSGSAGSITTTAGTTETTASTTTINSGDTSTASVSIGNKETVILNGGRGSVTIGSGGVLKGSGTAESVSVESGGVLAPGQSPGCITISPSGLDIQGTYEVEIAGTTACSGYDQAVVSGTVDVSGGTLNVSLLNGFVPALNNTFTIISNDGTDAVTGTFSGLVQGANVVVGGVTFHISYTGGDGNDVVLTTAAIPSTATVPNSGIAGLNRSIILPVMSAVLTGIGLLVIRKKITTTR